MSILKAARRIFGIQIEPESLKRVADAVRPQPAAKFLVFGVGNDSALWFFMNYRGRTVFLEDNWGWLNQIRVRYPYLTIEQVTYSSHRGSWRRLLGDDEALRMELPAHVLEEDWDVILVDAPSGVADSSPGRMESIYMAAQMLAEGGRCFIHDCHREVETAYADKYFGEEGYRTHGLMREYEVGRKASDDEPTTTRSAEIGRT
jgi:hypothetical protein